MYDDYNSESVDYVKLTVLLQKKEGIKPPDIIEIGKILKQSLRGLIDYLLDAGIDEIKSSPHYVEALRTIVKALRIVYNNSGYETGATDSEYDVLAEKLEIVDDLENEIEDQVHYKNKGYHLYPVLRGTLDKIYDLNYQKKSDSSRRGLASWVESTCQSYSKFIGPDGSDIVPIDITDLLNEPVYVFPKFDGISVIFELDENDRVERALTRGYTALNEACIVTGTFKNLLGPDGTLPFDRPPIPKVLGMKYGVKTEVMVSDESLVKYNMTNPKKRYKNTRSFASAIINNETNDPSLTKELRIIPLRYATAEMKTQELHPEVFKYPYTECILSDTEKIEDFAVDHHSIRTHDGETLRCDGAVICIKNSKYRAVLGRKNDKEKSEVAYKFTEEYAYTKVYDVKYSVGLYGTITPILQLDPVVMKGNLVSNVSLGSIGKLNELNVGKGDIIKIGYDIIPVCAFNFYDPKCKRSSNPRFQTPVNCPACGSKLEYTDVTAACKNPKCPSRIMGRIKNHVVRLRIRYIGDSLIEQMYYMGIVRDIPDLYKIPDKKNKMTSLPGFGNKKFKAVVEELHAVEERDIDEARLLSSLSLERLSYATFRRVLSEYTMEELLEIVDGGEFEKLEKIQGIGSATARWIVSGLTNKKNRKNLEFLEGILSVTEVGKSAPRYTLCFTSFPPGDPRILQVEDVVLTQGGVVVDSVTKDTTYLIVPDMAIHSNKRKKADKYKIPVFTAEEFIQRSIPQD